MLISFLYQELWVIQFYQVLHEIYWEFDDARYRIAGLRDGKYLTNDKW